MRLNILNDLHIGAIRSGGTTPASALALRLWILEEFRRNLSDLHGADLMILGDLFDTSHIPLYDLKETYKALRTWCEENQEHTLYNVRGNHDISRSSNVVSSFDFLGELLGFADNYVHVVAPMRIPHGYVIPHLRNQELFDEALAVVPACDNLFVHCNYNNGFAAQLDQSLNITAEQVQNLPVQRVVFGHEHGQKTGPKVFIPGNQIPTSMADLLDGRNKYRSQLSEAGYTLTSVLTNDGLVDHIDWQSPRASSKKFVRVFGEATGAEATEVVNAVNRIRKLSSASFVVSNGVTIRLAEVQTVDFESVLEGVQAFSVLEALRRHLSPSHFAKLESLNVDPA